MKINVDELVDAGLVKKKEYTEGKYAGLSVLKYTKKVFFKSLWNLSDKLLECRGTVVDQEDNIIVRPFKKIFNLGENGTTVEPYSYIIAPRKINGFLGCVTRTEKYGIIYSTTGSLDSEHISLIKKYVPEEIADKFPLDQTTMFEICDSTHPHIVYEDEGAYLIGIRNVSTGDLYTEELYDYYAEEFYFRRPEVWKGRFIDLPKTKREGYMIRESSWHQNTLCKIKSEFYLNKKALMRVGKNKANYMFKDPDKFKENLDEEFYPLFDKIVDKFTKEEYISLTEQERRKFIENNL